jgi:hypothetical protein
LDLVIKIKKENGRKCEEDFIIEIGLVLMITNSHHKRRKLMEAQNEKTI